MQGADLSETYYFRGLLHVRGETPNRPAAIADYDEAIRLNPQDPRAHQSRASSYIILKDYDRAIAGAKEAIKLTDTNEEGSFGPFVTLGNAYYAKGDYKQAIATYNQVIDIADGRDFTKAFGQAQGFYGRGVAELKLGENAKGQADIAKAKTLFPNVENVFAVFGMTPSGNGSAAQPQPSVGAPLAAGKPGSLGQVETKNVDQALNPDWNSHFADRSAHREIVIHITRPPDMRPRFSDMHLWIDALGTDGQAPPVYVVNVFDESAKVVTFDCPIPTQAKSCDQLWREKGASVIALARALRR